MYTLVNPSIYWKLVQRNMVGYLRNRRNKQKLTLFYKMVSNLTPYYLSSLVPSTVTEASGCTLEIQMILGQLMHEQASTSTLSYYLP